MKKEKSLYDENGRWVEERGRIKGAIRRAFRLSPQMKEVLRASRVELPPKAKKDGSAGKKNQVRYRCAGCGELFSQKHVQVDHIEPVVPLWKAEAEMTYDEIARGVFCKIDNLQVLCSTPKKLNGGKDSCHRIKTNKENYIRDYLLSIDEDKRIESIVKAEESYLSFLKDKEAKEEQKRLRKEERLKKKLAKIKSV